MVLIVQFFEVYFFKFQMFNHFRFWISLNDENNRGKVPLWEGNYDDEEPWKSEASDDSPIDPDFVDLEKFPEFANVTFNRAVLRAGDCAITPAKHIHFVRSYGRTIASMWMLRDDQKYLGTFCDAAKDKDNEYEIPLSEAQLLWDFPGIPGEPGYNEFKMGFPSWDDIRTKWVQETQQAPLYRKDFKKMYKNTGYNLGDVMMLKNLLTNSRIHNFQM